MKKLPAYLALEGGGSRARAALRHAGSIRVSVSVDGLNPVDIGYDAFKKRLRALVTPLLEQIDPPPSAIHACIAIAGAGKPAVEETCTRIVEEILLPRTKKVSVTVMTDVEALVKSCLSVQDGIILIAGTGSVCIAVKHGGKRSMRAQVGGWGTYLDSGSGFMMGAALLMAALRTADGRQKPTRAVELLCSGHGIEIQDVADHLLPPSREKIAGLAPFVLQAYRAGDAFARAVVRECVVDLVEMVGAARDRAGLGTGITIFLSGGLFRSPLIMRLFKQRLRRHLPKADLRLIGEPLIHILDLAGKL